MLKEYQGVRQHPGEATRRLFWDDYLQLYVWVSDPGEIVGFELSYDLQEDFRAFRWSPEAGIEHYRVDDGEGRALKKSVPVLNRDRASLDPAVLEEFIARSVALEGTITQLVASKLQDFLSSECR